MTTTNTPPQSLQAQKTPQQIFEDFHARNPHIYQLLVKYALEAQNAGMSRLSIRMLYDRLRWELQVSGTGPNQHYRLNDAYLPLYSRKIMANVPQLAGFFETRSCKR